MATDDTGIYAAIGAFIPAFGALCWGIFKGKESKPAVIIERDVEEESTQSARAVLDDATKERFDGLRADLRDARLDLREAHSETAAVRAENTAVRKDRDHGWDLARAWRSIAREQWYEINTLNVAAGRATLPPLPGLEEIEGKPPS